jgi:hypothetical protein
MADRRFAELDESRRHRADSALRDGRTFLRVGEEITRPGRILPRHCLRRRADEQQ